MVPPAWPTLRFSPRPCECFRFTSRRPIFLSGLPIPPQNIPDKVSIRLVCDKGYRLNILVQDIDEDGTDKEVGRIKRSNELVWEREPGRRKVYLY